MERIQTLDMSDRSGQLVKIRNALTGEDDVVLPQCEHCNAQGRKLTYVSDSHIALCPDCLRMSVLSDEASEDLERLLEPLMASFIASQRARGLHDLALLDIVETDVSDIAERTLAKAFGEDIHGLRQKLSRKINEEITGNPS